MIPLCALQQLLRNRPSKTSMQWIQNYLSSLIRPMVGLVDSAEMVVGITTAVRYSVLLFYTPAARSTMKSRTLFTSQTRSPSGNHLLFQFSWAHFLNPWPTHALQFAAFISISRSVSVATAVNGTKPSETYQPVCQISNDYKSTWTWTLMWIFSFVPGG